MDIKHNRFDVLAKRDKLKYVHDVKPMKGFGKRFVAHSTVQFKLIKTWINQEELRWS